MGACESLQHHAVWVPPSGAAGLVTGGAVPPSGAAGLVTGGAVPPVGLPS